MEEVAIFFIVLLFIVIMFWYLNERSKRIHEVHKRKEEKYLELVRSLRAFHVDPSSKELREEFLNHLNLCLMYCSDKLIQEAYKFLLVVDSNNKEEKAF